MAYDLEAEVLKKMHGRIVKSFLDILILAKLNRGGPMSGYDVISFIHDRFHLLVSSGTVYSLLYSLERDGLIKGKWVERKRVYTLTGKGQETIKNILSAYGKIQSFMATLLVK